MRSSRPVLPLCLVAGLAWPAGAFGATVGGTTYEVSESENSTYTVTAVTFVAAPGEVNDVRVRPVPGGMAFTDAGAPLQAGAGCATSGAEVVCRPLPGTDKALGDVSVDTRDLGDRVVSAVDATITGGTGDDVLTADPATTAGVFFDGGPGADTLTGGPRADTLVGGSGQDVLAGGGGDDTLSGDTLRQVTAPASEPPDTVRDTEIPADDTIDGGAGSDTVTYEERAQFDPNDLDPKACCGAGFPGVVADLQARTGGSPGQDVDRFTSIENVTGTDSDDRLLGDGGPNTLDGGDRGVDRIDGRAGNDDVGSGGSGTVTGGAGNDRVSSLEGTATCGTGRDFLNPFGRYSEMGLRPAPLVIPRDCERTSFFNADVDVPVRVVGGVARVHMVSTDRRPDAGAILLLHGGRVVGRIAKVPTTRTGAAGRTLSARLTAAGRRALALGGGHTSLTLRYVFAARGGVFTIRTTLRGR